MKSTFSVLSPRRSVYHAAVSSLNVDGSLHMNCILRISTSELSCKTYVSAVDIYICKCQVVLLCLGDTPSDVSTRMICAMRHGNQAKYMSSARSVFISALVMCDVIWQPIRTVSLYLIFQENDVDDDEVECILANLIYEVGTVLEVGWG